MKTIFLVMLVSFGTFSVARAGVNFHCVATTPTSSSPTVDLAGDSLGTDAMATVSVPDAAGKPRVVFHADVREFRQQSGSSSMGYIGADAQGNQFMMEIDEEGEGKLISPPGTLENPLDMACQESR